MANDSEKTEEIEFADWPTPIADSRLEIAEVCYLPNHDWNEPHLSETLQNSIAGKRQKNDFIIRVFDHDKDAYFRIEFEYVGAFRILDEHGLQEIWGAAGYKDRKFQSTLKVRNHSWIRESPVSFFMGTKDKWSYIVVTDFECVEILSQCEPKVVQE